MVLRMCVGGAVERLLLLRPRPRLACGCALQGVMTFMCAQCVRW